MSLRAYRVTKPVETVAQSTWNVTREPEIIEWIEAHDGSVRLYEDGGGQIEMERDTLASLIEDLRNGTLRLDEGGESSLADAFEADLKILSDEEDYIQYEAY